MRMSVLCIYLCYFFPQLWKSSYSIPNIQKNMLSKAFLCFSSLLFCILQKHFSIEFAFSHAEERMELNRKRVKRRKKRLRGGERRAENHIKVLILVIHNKIFARHLICFLANWKFLFHALCRCDFLYIFLLLWHGRWLGEINRYLSQNKKYTERNGRHFTFCEQQCTSYNCILSVWSEGKYTGKNYQFWNDMDGKLESHVTMNEYLRRILEIILNF